MALPFKEKKIPQLTYLCLPQISYANDSRSRQPEIYTFVGRTHIYTGLKSVLPSERIGRQARVGRKHGQAFARTCRTVMERSADCRSSRRPATRWKCRTVFFFAPLYFVSYCITGLVVSVWIRMWRCVCGMVLMFVFGLLDLCAFIKKKNCCARRKIIIAFTLDGNI